MVDRYRTLHGNRTFEKQDFARGLLAAMKKGETVGLLMDQNMTPPQGVFVNILRHSGLHGQRTGARCSAYGCGCDSGVHDLGFGASPLPSALRSGAHADPDG